MKKLVLGLMLATSMVVVANASTFENYAAVKLPDTIIGDWCILEWGDEQNSQQIFIRTPPDGCHVADGGIGIDQKGTDGGEAGRCIFDKIEQIANNAVFYPYQMHEHRRWTSSV